MLKMPSLLLLLISSVLQNNLFGSQNCIGEDPEIVKLLQAQKDKKSEFEKVFQNCEKIVFKSPKTRAVFFYVNNTIHNIHKTSSSGLDLEPPSAKCIMSTISRIRSYQDRTLERILDKIKIQQGSLFWDSDRGATGNTECPLHRQDVADRTSLFIHETTHLLDQDNCLYLADEDRNLCFSKDLPDRKLAALDSSFWSNLPESTSNTYKSVHELYFDKTFSGPQQLTELNAYSIEILSYIYDHKKPIPAIVYKEGNKTIKSYSGTVSNNLPFFLLMTRRYLEKATLSDLDRKNILYLVKRGEKYYERYLTFVKSKDHLKQQQQEIEEVQSPLWKYYQKKYCSKCQN